MGFNLGLAAAAYQGVKAEERRIADDEFRKAQRDYELANQEEHKSRRGYRDNAAGLADDEVTARRTMLPKKAELEGLTLDDAITTQPLRTQATTGALNATIADQAANEKTRPVREETAQVTADTGLVMAKTGKSNADEKARMTPLEQKLRAQEIDNAIAGNAVARGEFQDKIFGTIYESATTGKMGENGIIARLNDVAHSQLFPELHGKTVGDIETKGDIMEIRDTSGAVIAKWSVDSMKAARDKLYPGKIVTMADGVNAYRDDGRGSLTKLTDNKKSFAERGGLVGRAGGSNAVIDRVAKSLIDEAKSGGAPINEAEAYRRASAMLKSNPGAWAAKALANDLEYQMEKDPDKRRAMQEEAVQTAKELASGAAGGSAPAPAGPGLDRASPQSQAVVKSFLGL